MITMIKGWALDIASFIAVVFFFLFQWRGRKIAEQEEEIQIKDSNINELDLAIKTQTETINKTEKANDILSENINVTDAVERLRERARKSGDGNKD